nr:GNAT family N-acetyltransferase [Bacilli bacterium]
MIDTGYQNKGFGKELLIAMIRWCKAFPFGESDTIYTSCDINNKKAISLYQSMGFMLTDEYVDGEVVLRRNLKEEE